MTYDLQSRAADVLLDSSRSIAERIRAMFTLKNLNTDGCVEYLCQCLKSYDSSLLKHEAAYCLGQMDNVLAVPTLLSVLRDEKQTTIVRHETAEALGAIQSRLPNDEVDSALSHYLNAPQQTISETCKLSLARRLKFRNGAKSLSSIRNSYSTIDPALPFLDSDSTMLPKSTLELASILNDQNADLEQRYRAMFTLRDLKSDDAIDCLSAALITDHSSALFRHEVAFVLGQLQSPRSVDALITCLDSCDTSDAESTAMVKHECAEALGAIATPQALDRLQSYLQEEAATYVCRADRGQQFDVETEDIVAESCLIALDIGHHQRSEAEFQYADVL